jgi:hypothetical protein
MDATMTATRTEEVTAAEVMTRDVLGTLLDRAGDGPVPVVAA